MEVKPQAPDMREESDEHDGLNGAVPVDESFASDMDLEDQDAEASPIRGTNYHVCFFCSKIGQNFSKSLFQETPRKEPSVA